MGKVTSFGESDKGACEVLIHEDRVRGGVEDGVTFGWVECGDDCVGHWVIGALLVGGDGVSGGVYIGDG